MIGPLVVRAVTLFPEVAANEVVRSLGFTRTVPTRTFNRVCAMSHRHLQKCAHRGAST